MIITLFLLICCVGALLTGLVHYRAKFWNYSNIADKAEEELLESKNELIALDIDLTKRFEEAINELEKRFEDEKVELKKRFQHKFSNSIVKKNKELEKKFEEKYNSLAKNLELDYNNACEEVKNELFEQLDKVDEVIKNHAEELALKNILTFSCSCSKDLIPVAIDFTKENTFICPKCSSKYKIAINANPILIGRAISDEQFADLLEKRLYEDKTGINK